MNPQPTAYKAVALPVELRRPNLLRGVSGRAAGNIISTERADNTVIESFRGHLAAPQVGWRTTYPDTVRSPQPGGGT